MNIRSYLDTGFFSIIQIDTLIIILLGTALGLLLIVARRRKQQGLHAAAINAQLTEETEAKARLIESERRYRDVVTHIKEVIFRTDREGRLSFLNPAWVDLTGFKVEETLGRQAMDFIHVDDCARARSRIRKLIKREASSFRDEFRYVRADGGFRWVEVFAHLSANVNDHIDGIYGTLLDVSERRQITEALRAERDLFAAGPAVAFIWRNEQGWPVEYVSSNVAAELGYAPKEMMAPDFRFVDLIHADDLVRILTEGRAHRAKRRAAFELNYRIRNRGGEYRWFREYSMPQWGAGCEGEPARIRGYLLDETATMEARLALEQSRQRLAWILEGANVGTMEWDLEQDEVIINTRWAEMLGYTVEELTPLTTSRWREMAHPDDREGCRQGLLDMLHHRLPYYEGEHRMRSKDGSWVWVLTRGRALKYAPDGRSQLICGTQIDITQRKAAEAHAAHLAYYDELTGLPNRRMLLEKLCHAQASSARTHYVSALLFIDLDNFKNLNDTLGHDYGDMLLKEVAIRLSRLVRAGDSIARLGGDEFVVLFEELDVRADNAIANAERAVRKVLTSLSAPYRLNEHEHHITPSIGVTLFGDNGDSSETLMKKADLAMYQAKAAGKGTFRFFDPQMQAAAELNRQIEVEMRRGLEQSQFAVAYQPIVGVTGVVVAVEALLRWRHPERGMVSPAEFIPVAEKSGLIVPLGRWVLRTACAQLAAWKAYPQRAGLSIAVNVSAIQFHQPDFISDVVSILRGSGADGHRLRLEITESMLLDSVDETIEKTIQLRAAGVSFSLDDFGTGYSSLNYLKRLPMSVVKIDQSFVRDIEIDPNDAAIVQTIIAMAHSLGLQVVAEGVESEGQRDFLVAHGCDFLQGFLLHRPMFIESLELVLP